MMAWSVLEPAVYFTSACMLTYKPLLRRFLYLSGLKSALMWRTSIQQYKQDRSQSTRPTGSSTRMTTEIQRSAETIDRSGQGSNMEKPLPPPPAVRIDGRRSLSSSRRAHSEPPRCWECDGCLSGGRCENLDRVLSFYLKV